MADISQITIGDVAYNIKDSRLPRKDSGIEIHPKVVYSESIDFFSGSTSASLGVDAIPSYSHWFTLPVEEANSSNVAITQTLATEENMNKVIILTSSTSSLTRNRHTTVVNLDTDATRSVYLPTTPVLGDIIEAKCLDTSNGPIVLHNDIDTVMIGAPVSGSGSYKTASCNDMYGFPCNLKATCIDATDKIWLIENTLM